MNQYLRRTRILRTLGPPVRTIEMMEGRRLRHRQTITIDYSITDHIFAYINYLNYMLIKHLFNFDFVALVRVML